jgi:Ran GTPase-activating protein (RanGAP) involved in mRNA processing and transport
MAAIERYGVANDMVTVLHPASVGIPCLESDVCDLATELSYNHHITTANFSNIKIGVEGAIALGKAIGPGSRSVVQFLKLSGCGMTAEAIEGLVKHACGNRRLEILDVSSNSVRDEGALHLAKFVEATQSIRILEAADCKIGPHGASALAGCISTHRKLNTLNLANNKLREAGTAALMKGLAENSSISVLDLSGNSINCEGGVAIAETLRKNKSIESINLRNNFISESIPQVALALSQRGVPARVVDLSRNRVTSAICRSMSQVLEGQSFNIACLAVEGNPIADDGLVALFHALRGTNVQFLDLSDTTLTAASGVVLADLIRACPIINSLQLDNNALGDSAMVEIAKAYRESHSMAALNVENTAFGHEGCMALARAFEAQKHLRSVNIAVNRNLEPADILAFLAALSSLRTVERVDLSDLRIPDSEDILRSLIAVFAMNEYLEQILLHHNPIAAGFPESGVMHRAFALQLADGASLKSFLTVAGGGDTQMTINMSASASTSRHNTSTANRSTAVSTTVGGNTKSGNVSTAALFRPAWGTVVPMEHKTSVVNTHRDELDDTAEDGRVPPLVPHPLSLHHPLYPGYAKGRFTSAQSIGTMSNTVPYTVENSRGHPMPLNLSADMSAQLKYPLTRPLKASPYNLAALELNVGGLLITEDQLKRKFKELDIDGNGFLDRAEFRAAYLSYQSYGVAVTERELDAWMRQLDVGHGARLYFDEFSVLMLKLAQR